MKKTILTLLLALGASYSMADRQSVDEAKSAAAEGEVMIKVTRGEVSVRTWDRDEVRVLGLLDEELKEFVFEVRGDLTHIEVKIPRHSGSGWFGREGSDLTITVPEASHLDIAGVSTDVKVNGAGGRVDVGVVSGDVHVSGGEDRIHLQTVSGSIDLRDANGRLRLKTVSGDIDAVGSSGNGTFGTVSGEILVREGGQELELQSVSGDIEVFATPFGRISGHSVSGTIEVTGEMSPTGSVEFNSVSGDIRLRLGSKVAARFDLETGSGSIRNRITDDKPKSGKYVRDEHLRFTVGAGNGEVNVSTRSGDISVAR